MISELKIIIKVYLYFSDDKLKTLDTLDFHLLEIRID
jgi:hypothetical protein